MLEDYSSQPLVITNLREETLPQRWCNRAMEKLIYCKSEDLICLECPEKSNQFPLILKLISITILGIYLSYFFTLFYYYFIDSRTLHSKIIFIWNVIVCFITLSIPISIIKYFFIYRYDRDCNRASVLCDKIERGFTSVFLGFFLAFTGMILSKGIFETHIIELYLQPNYALITIGTFILGVFIFEGAISFKFFRKFLNGTFYSRGVYLDKMCSISHFYILTFFLLARYLMLVLQNYDIPIMDVDQERNHKFHRKFTTMFLSIILAGLSWVGEISYSSDSVIQKLLIVPQFVIIIGKSILKKLTFSKDKSSATAIFSHNTIHETTTKDLLIKMVSYMYPLFLILSMASFVSINLYIKDIYIASLNFGSLKSAALGGFLQGFGSRMMGGTFLYHIFYGLKQLQLTSCFISILLIIFTLILYSFFPSFLS